MWHLCMRKNVHVHDIERGVWAYPFVYRIESACLWCRHADRVCDVNYLRNLCMRKNRKHVHDIIECRGMGYGHTQSVYRIESACL